jgi:hypothetical protein
MESLRAAEEHRKGPGKGLYVIVNIPESLPHLIGNARFTAKPREGSLEHVFKCATRALTNQ